MPDSRLLAHLVALGASEEEVAGLEDGSLIGLAGDLQLSADLDRTLEEVAAEAGFDLDRARSVYTMLGLPVEGLAGFGDNDLAMLSFISGDTSGVIAEVGPQLLRVAGTSMARLAEAAVAAYVQDIEPRDAAAGDLIELADRNALASALAVGLGRQLATIFQHHMWTAVRRQRNAQADVTSPEMVRAAIGFIDLVGFTSLSNVASPAELIATIEHFEQRAFETAAHHGGRIVKSIGDEVMIIATRPNVVAAIALDLVSGSGGDPSVAPRGGISAGQVLFRLGDYYGPVVNLAARLAAEAVPGEVLSDQAAAFGPGVTASAAGRRVLKGFEDPVPVWTIETAGGPPGRRHSG